MRTKNEHDCPKMAFGDEKGMTLQDYYAGQALTGILARRNSFDLSHHSDCELLAEVVWDVSGAMMVERNRCI